MCCLKYLEYFTEFKIVTFIGKKCLLFLYLSTQVKYVGLNKYRAVQKLTIALKTDYKNDNGTVQLTIKK